MERLYVFLIRNDVWIYILAALGLFWYTTELWRSRKILRRAIFGLERESGTRMRNNALLFMTLFTIIIGSVFFVNNQIAPTLPPSLLKPPTPTPNLLSTPLSSPTPLGTPEEPPLIITPDLVPTVTLIGEQSNQEPGGDFAEELPTVTPTAFIPPTPFIDCTVDLNISEPRDGAVVSNNISFSGTVDTENFLYYTMETNGPQTNGQWASLLGRNINQTVREGFLGNTNLSLWSPGPYLIRLTAIDIGDNITGQCVIQVTLSDNS
jgi:hypothetical protein